jgi:hypothetical protein
MQLTLQTGSGTLPVKTKNEPRKLLMPLSMGANEISHCRLPPSGMPLPELVQPFIVEYSFRDQKRMPSGVLSGAAKELQTSQIALVKHKVKSRKQAASIVHNSLTTLVHLLPLMAWLTSTQTPAMPRNVVLDGRFDRRIAMDLKSRIKF